MPFQKGNQLAKGRGRLDGATEQKLLARMTKLFSGYLTLAEKIKDGKANPQQEKAFESLKALVLKISDKLHATKTATDITDETNTEEVKQISNQLKDLIKEVRNERKGNKIDNGISKTVQN